MIPSNYPPDPMVPRGTFLYRVDVLARDNPKVQIGDGSGSGEWRDVLLSVVHPDAYSGKMDVVGMIVWGDIDPNSHSRIASVEANSAFIPYTTQLPIVLSAGAGVKTITAKIFFASGRTVQASATHTLTDGTPHVSILRQPKGDVLLTSETVSFAWSCSHAVTAFSVCLVSANDALVSSGAPITSGTNISGTASVGAMVETSFSYASALAASGAAGMLPLSTTGQTWVKVFATTAKGTTT